MGYIPSSGSGLPSGGAVNQTVLNTAPNTGTWQDVTNALVAGAGISITPSGHLASIAATGGGIVGGPVNMVTAYGADPTGSTYSDSSFSVTRDPWMFFPGNTGGQVYKFAFPLHLWNAQRITGATSVTPHGTVLHWDAGVSGILVDYINGGVDGGGSVVEYIELLGQGGSANARGLSFRRSGQSTDVATNGWGGSGQQVCCSMGNGMGVAQTATFATTSTTMTLTAGAFTNNDKGGMVTFNEVSGSWPIPTGTQIVSITDATHAVLSAAATANQTGVTCYTNGSWGGNADLQTIADFGVITNAQSQNNGGSGIEFSAGADAQVWNVLGGFAASNTGWAIFDNSQAGNALIGFGSESNTAGSYSATNANLTYGHWDGLYSEGSGSGSVGPSNGYLKMYSCLLLEGSSGYGLNIGITPGDIIYRSWRGTGSGLTGGLMNLSVCHGVPTSQPNQANGDIAFRQDGGAGTAIYQLRAGTWTAVA